MSASGWVLSRTPSPEQDPPILTNTAISSAECRALCCTRAWDRSRKTDRAEDGCVGPGWGPATKGHEGTSGGDRNALYLDCGGSYPGVNFKKKKIEHSCPDHPLPCISPGRVTTRCWVNAAFAWLILCL